MIKEASDFTDVNAFEAGERFSGRREIARAKQVNKRSYWPFNVTGDFLSLRNADSSTLSHPGVSSFIS